jgi:hypothetical protein
MDIFGYNPIVSPIYVEPAFDRSNVVTTSQRQPRTVTGVVDSGDGFTIVQYSDGTTERRAGSRGIRNNNPGNLTGTLQGALRQGAVAVDHGGNYVFPDAQTGQRAMANFVLQRNADRSIGDMLGTYAPAGAANDPNNTNRLYPSMVQGAGFNLGDRVGALPAAEQQRLLDTMMGIETGQPAPARQVATLNSPGRGTAQRGQGVLGQLFGGGGGFRPQFLGDVPSTDGYGGGGGGGAGGISDRATGRIPGPVNKEAAASKARTLGLMGDMGAAEALAGTTADAVQEASTRGGIAKPLNKREREKFSPESLGLIAFGLSLLGGADMAQATQIGLQTYETVDDRRSLAKQREAVDKFIAQQPPELQEVLRVVGGDNKTIADLTMRYKEMQGDQAQAEAIQAQLQEADLSPEKAAQVAAAKDPAAELTKVKEDARLVERNRDTIRQQTELALDDIQQLRDMIGYTYIDENGEEVTVRGMSNDRVPLDALRGARSVMPGSSKAKDYRQRLQSLQARIGFRALADMRNNSPTGAGLGSVTELELDLLQATLGPLNVDTDYQTVMESLDSVEASYRRMLDAAEEDYGRFFNSNTGAATGSAAQSYDFGGQQYEVSR